MDFQSQILKIKESLAQIPQWSQKTQAWEEKKKTLLTATEISTLFQCNPFQTQQELYQRKVHPEEVENWTTLSTEWGELYEPIAKQYFKHSHPEILEIIELGLGVHPDLNYLGASPDGLLICVRDNQLELWLIEVKCPHQRLINKRIPFHYWLQMQTQLYVWQALLAHYNVDCSIALKGCIYNENEFPEIATNPPCPRKTWEYPVIYDETYFNNAILPEITQFGSYWLKSKSQSTAHIEIQEDVKVGQKRKQTNSRGKLTPKKRQREAEDLYYQYLNSKAIKTQKQYRNYYVNQDPILDWLALYGDQHHYPKDKSISNETSLSLKTYICNQSLKFNQKIYEYVTSSKLTSIRIGFRVLPLDSLIEDHINPKDASRHHLAQTLQAMRSHTDIIINAVLYHPHHQSLGYYDILMTPRAVNELFPVAFQKLKQVEAFPEDNYIPIQIRYSKLSLCAKNQYILNMGSQKAYKIEQAHLSQVLDYYQAPGPGLIMGRKSSYSSKKISYENYNAYNSFGVVDFRDRDRDILESLSEAQEWLMEVKTMGSSWTIDPIHPVNKLALYPNLKNQQDAPWSTFKRELGQKHRDLTQIWYIGQTERTRVWDLYEDNPDEIIPRRWDQLQVSDLKYNDHYKDIIQNIITANRDHVTCNLDILGKHLRETVNPIEFHLDFEFVSDLVDDFSTWPHCNLQKYIYMIGCVYVNHETGAMKYMNYLVNRLDKAQETVMLQTFLKDLDQLNEKRPEINMFHWGHAEKTQITNYLISQDQLDVTGDWCHISKKIKLNDLCEQFKNFKTAIPGCYGYGLKEIAKQFYQNGWIKTTWNDGLNGEDAMVGAIVADQECQNGTYTHLSQVPIMADFIRYNSVDCLVMPEIVNYLRQIT